jgi:Ser-tRNA(Ala) deacylase AlaX
MATLSADGAVPPTERVYQRDSYQFELSTTVVRVDALDDNKHGTHKVVLTATIFHPQGGGQPSDVGQLFAINADGTESLLFTVAFVQAHGDIIEHFGRFAGDTEAEAQSLTRERTVIARVNSESRVLHTRLHSAGHTIDAVIKQLGYADQLLPTKGYHFRDAPYVEYDASKCTLTEAEFDSLLQRANEVLKQLVSQGIETKVMVMEKSEAENYCQGPLNGYPEIVRVVEVADTPCPCGGTHVNNTKELGLITIQKMKKKKNVLKVSYVID